MVEEEKSLTMGGENEQVELDMLYLGRICYQSRAI